jgi:hypothetical protein
MKPTTIAFVAGVAAGIVVTAAFTSRYHYATTGVVLWKADRMSGEVYRCVGSVGTCVPMTNAPAIASRPDPPAAKRNVFDQFDEGLPEGFTIDKR